MSLYKLDGNLSSDQSLKFGVQTLTPSVPTFDLKLFFTQTKRSTSFRVMCVLTKISAVRLCFGTSLCVWITCQLLINTILQNYQDMIQPLQHTMIGLPKQEFDFLIFQIGFNKAGTTSLFKFMAANDVPSIHNTPCRFHVTQIWERSNYLYLNQYMLDNLRKNGTNVVLPSECTDYYQFYSDFGNEIGGPLHMLKQTVRCKVDVINNKQYNEYMKPWYPVLVERHQNSKFIVNIRNINSWLKSKYLHRPPYFRLIRFNQRKQQINQYILENNETMRLNRGFMTDIELLRIFRNEWYLYICNLIKYFETNQIMDNLLIFDVSSDPIQKLIDFFKKFGLKLNAKYWKRKNKSSNKPKWTSNQDWEQRQKWKEIEKKYPEFNTDYSNVTETEYDRINAFCKAISL